MCDEVRGKVSLSLKEKEGCIGSGLMRDGQREMVREWMQ